ncbi:hypothetical protein LIPSTDRAFT_73191 [Lipomyces starkeyi NRRL Y-11557]|uniref:Uncharacterized protein n=1 Tax=Lipomyces starkeyi NRRL Y-11557 TaxID=675824 RepID=A0A1E3Q1G4_LIPST|nr:hypothetical protein LIPSTDRAFT_73191 [Lipomyces starkeyi NRRL Y-11557]
MNAARWQEPEETGIKEKLWRLLVPNLYDPQILTPCLSQVQTGIPDISIDENDKVQHASDKFASANQEDSFIS